MSTIVSATAFANNEIALIAWALKVAIPDCMGFEVTRIYTDTGKERVLPAWVPFEGQKNPFLHRISPGQMHCESTQIAPKLHIWPQKPQLFGSVCESTHVSTPPTGQQFWLQGEPPQSGPEEGAHDPFTQVSPVAQQAPWQQFPLLHTLPQAPQLF